MKANKSKNWFLFLAVICIFIASAGFAQASKIEEDIIYEVNKERVSAGLNELRENELLSKAAFLKVQDMVGNDYFAHTSPQNFDPWHWLGKVEYQYKYAGENLAMDFSSASSVHKAWMKSKTHKDNILSSKYKEMGTAVLEGIIDGEETRVAVQFFGTPLNEDVSLTNAVSEKETKEEKQEDSEQIKLEEVSIRPWETDINDEMIVYAKLSGEPLEVEAQIGRESFPLQQVQDYKFMSLLTLDNMNLDEDVIVIKAQANEKEALYFQVPKGVYAEHIVENEEEQEEQSNDILVAASASLPLLGVKERALDSQNIILAGFVLVCMVMIGNVWILEKEEEKLVHTYSA